MGSNTGMPRSQYEQGGQSPGMFGGLTGIVSRNGQPIPNYGPGHRASLPDSRNGSPAPTPYQPPPRQMGRGGSMGLDNQHGGYSLGVPGGYRNTAGPTNAPAQAQVNPMVAALRGRAFNPQYIGVQTVQQQPRPTMPAGGPSAPRPQYGQQSSLPGDRYAQPQQPLNLPPGLNRYQQALSPLASLPTQSPPMGNSSTRDTMSQFAQLLRALPQMAGR